MKKVNFESNGVKLVGNLYLPENITEPMPCLPIIGPMTFVKEQVPTEYAKRLAKKGFITLVFDTRYHGESEGEPRRWENPTAKVEDVSAAIDFLASLPEVDKDQIFTLAVCQGSSEMIRVAAEDERVKSLVTVAGHYRDSQADVEWLGEEGLKKRLERGKKAKAKFEATGEIDYVPAVDPERTDAGMPGKFVWDWYHVWADKGIWENRYAVMSDEDLLSYESLTAAQKLDKPFLMIHSDNCFLPNAARKHFESVPSKNKKLLWDNSKNHFQFYDDAEVLDQTVEIIAEFYKEHFD